MDNPEATLEPTEDRQESFETLETLDAVEPAPDDDDAAAAAKAPASLPPKSMRVFENSIFPVLLLDKDFTIIHANKACDHLFNGFFHAAGNRFADVFGKHLGPTALREIRETLLTGRQGYSWKGTAKFKTRATGSIQTKVYLFPTGLRVRPPSEFIVLFDDVTEENRQLLRSVFISLLEASKLKDNDTGKHIVRVNFYSQALSETMYDRPGYEEIDRDFIDDIGFLASMHDVGKIGTPDDILNKEGPLTDWEWTIMREHPKNGAFILSTYPNPMAREIALNHHERWDGTGYPFQLEGTMIPLSARIVTLADVYDALRMKRSYKEAYGHQESVSKILEWSGSHFDPAIIAIFREVSDRFGAIHDDNRD
jgi:putative two-component system response regulator